MHGRSRRAQALDGVRTCRRKVGVAVGSGGAMNESASSGAPLSAATTTRSYELAAATCGAPAAVGTALTGRSA
jgi:hypothetical protein